MEKKNFELRADRINTFNRYQPVWVLTTNESRSPEAIQLQPVKSIVHTELPLANESRHGQKGDCLGQPYVATIKPDRARKINE